MKDTAKRKRGRPKKAAMFTPQANPNFDSGDESDSDYMIHLLLQV